MYIHHITSKEYEKMNNYHQRKKDDTMYNIDDYYYASTILNNSTEDGKRYVSINLSGMSYVVVKRNGINSIMMLIESSDIEDINKFIKGYTQIIFPASC